MDYTVHGILQARILEYFLSLCLSLCRWHFKVVPMYLESMSQRHYTNVLNISRLISLFIPNSAVLKPWNRNYADPQRH